MDRYLRHRAREATADPDGPEAARLRAERLEKWGPGPWIDEPDYEKFVSDNGYACYVKRHRENGHLCGYVGIPFPHHFVTGRSGYLDFDVHGGVTYDEYHPDHDAYLIGFDCNHWNDISPLCIKHYPDSPGEYRTFDYVRQETLNLARQIYEWTIRHEP